MRIGFPYNAVIGMQNRELTMFVCTVIVIWFREFIQACCVLWDRARLCVCRLTVELLKNAFPDWVVVRELSSLKRACGAFYPFVEGYAGQG